MKIIQFIASDGFGGAEKVVMDLCNAMADEHEIHFITFDPNVSRFSIHPKVNVHKFSKFGRRNIFALMKLALFIKALKADVIHTHGVKASDIIYRLRHVVSCLQIGTKHNARKGKIFDKIEYVTAVSREVAQSISHDHVEVIYNGIVPKSVHRQDDSQPTLQLLAVGRLDPVKQFDRLIEVCSELPVPYQLKIVGEGEMFFTLQDKIRQMNLEKNIVLLGFQDDIPQLMADADCVVMSSRHEGFPLVMVEALYYAKMFLSTPVGGAKELLPSLYLSEMKNMREKLVHIAEHKSWYWRQFGKLQKQLQPEFLLSNIAKKYVSYYQEVKQSEVVQ